MTAKAAQLASACQSGICKGDAVACLLPDEAHLDQGVKGRALALVDSTASPGQSDVAQQLGLFFVPACRHPATPILAASTFCVASSLARAHQGYHPQAKTVGKAKGNQPRFFTQSRSALAVIARLAPSVRGCLGAVRAISSNARR